MYELRVSDNNHTSVYGPFASQAAMIKERTQLIAAYGYNKGKGFARETYKDIDTALPVVVFRHAIYSDGPGLLQPGYSAT